MIAAVDQGVEAFRHRGTLERAGPGTVALINPDTPHTGHAGVPEGWTHRVLYPQPDLVRETAAQTTSIPGRAAFRVAVADDPHAPRCTGPPSGTTRWPRTPCRGSPSPTCCAATRAPPAWPPCRESAAPPGRRAREVLLERMQAPRR